ncbi:hypothetical protein [Chitinophaga sp. S165]|uniref:hypothetical protein n=1 Tax=Chitinophaga sp. S165 TaxID=2135462 RepID=UPI000D8BE73E|nr:hypothetical protein [Chitinophaga sp. S165]PWV44388.1 hypothetical protein C7475_1263 [Chitinophaga sp. S165]
MKVSQIMPERSQDITVEDVKALSSFKDYSTSQAEELINTIKTFTTIGLTICSQRSSPIKIIDLPNIKYEKKIA